MPEKTAVEWYNEGIDLDNSMRYDEAIACYDRALEIDPKFVPAWSGKGYTLRKLNRYSEAIACYDCILEIDPKSDLAWRGKGYTLRKLNRYSKAITCYDRILEIDPKSSNTWSGKGYMLRKLKRYSESIACYDRILESDPKSSNAWSSKGDALYNLGHYDEAIQCYDKALRINSENAVVWNWKALALNKLGRYGEVIKCYDRVLEIDPKYADAKKNRELVLKKIGKRTQNSRSTSPTADEPGRLSPVRITIERTVYDPLTRDFITSFSRPLVNVRNWIDQHDPASYWLVICAHNYGDDAIDEWGVELDSSSALRVLGAFIEGIKGQMHLQTSNPKPWLVRSILGISHHRGIVIPRDGSRRVYFRLGSESCGISHTIQGKLITSSVEVPIREKTFTYSCDVATLRTALSSDPAAAGQYAENIIRRAYDRDTALKLLRSFKLVQEIDQCCTLQNYDEILNQMQLLAGTLEDIQAGDKLTRLVKQNYDALTILGDSEASAERAQRLCKNVIDVWINEFICMEDPKKHSIKSKPRERGEDAGKCPVCGSRLVWRRAQKNNELYRGCTNFDGGCGWNDRSY